MTIEQSSIPRRRCPICGAGTHYQEFSGEYINQIICKNEYCGAFVTGAWIEDEATVARWNTRTAAADVCIDGETIKGCPCCSGEPIYEFDAWIDLHSLQCSGCKFTVLHCTKSEVFRLWSVRS